MLTFNSWINLNESFSFDPDANYPDKTFGFVMGDINSGKANIGGINDDWGGSMQRALAFGKVANDFVGKNIVSSQKRSRVKTASGNVSDHYEGSKDSYAVDVAANGEKGDALLAHLMQWCGHPEYKGGSWFNFNSGGYRYQIGWRVKGHFDHIHIGVRRTTKSDTEPTTQIANTENSTQPAKKEVSVPGKTPGEKILNNQVIVNWLFTMIPDLADGLTPDQLNKTFETNPEHFKWFKDKFGLNDNGDPIKTPNLSNDSNDTEELIDNQLSNKEIQSNYSSNKADNIKLLTDEITSQGVTNKYAIIGILSTIGKESGFVPQNEQSYANTSNIRIKSLFGDRVKGLSDSELTSLKQNPPAFFDKIYGPEATSKIGWNTGNTSPGDGYKYRGRGFNQITFKSNYQKYSDAAGIDIVSNPDQLNDIRVASKVAVAFLLNGLKRLGLDPNSFKTKREAIKAFVQVNAGGSSAPSNEVAKAEEVSKNFTLA